MRLSLRQPNRLISVAQWPRKNVDLVTAHLTKLRGPKMIPKRIVRCIWNARVKTHFIKLPSLCATNRDSEGTDIVIWKRVAERDFRGIEQVLSVHEGDRTFN